MRRSNPYAFHKHCGVLEVVIRRILGICGEEIEFDRTSALEIIALTNVLCHPVDSKFSTVFRYRNASFVHYEKCDVALSGGHAIMFWCNL